jgi:hypothetical protein
VHTIDVNAFVGAYPFRYLPHPDPEVLVRVLAREGVAGAWVASLPAVFHRDPSHANAALFAALAPFAPTLQPVPTVRAGWPGWERVVGEAAERGAPAVRVYPNLTGASAGDVVALARACASAGLVLLFNVKLEDVRQRHPMDAAGDLSAAVVRAAIRQSEARVIVTAAGREMIEELHWSLAPTEQDRLWYDVSWIWGPPEDHLAKLLRSLGAGRFVFGTAWPLRLTQTPRATLALLPDDVAAPALADPTAIARAACAAAGR